MYQALTAQQPLQCRMVVLQDGNALPQCQAHHPQHLKGLGSQPTKRGAVDHMMFSKAAFQLHELDKNFQFFANT